MERYYQIIKDGTIISTGLTPAEALISVTNSPYRPSLKWKERTDTGGIYPEKSIVWLTSPDPDKPDILLKGFCFSQGPWTTNEMLNHLAPLFCNHYGFTLQRVETL